MAIGNFPGMAVLNRRTIRANVNPLDKSTIVSIFPKDVYEVKPTIQPGVFFIPAGSLAKPSIVVVGPSSWWKDVDENQPLLEIPSSSIQIADSIVKDYCGSLLAANAPEIMPGMFYVPGEHDVESIYTNYRNELGRANIRQRNWYTALVRLADALWANTNGNPLAISDDMRLSARELGFANKDWMADFRALEMIRCAACGALRNPLYPICGSCHTVVDKDKATELGLITTESKPSSKEK